MPGHEGGPGLVREERGLEEDRRGPGQDGEHLRIGARRGDLAELGRRQVLDHPGRLGADRVALDETEDGERAIALVEGVVQPERLEVEGPVLELMGELVGVRDPLDRPEAAGAADDEQLVDRGVVVADHLAPLEVEVDLLEGRVVGEEAERLVDPLADPDLGLGIGLLEVRLEVRSELVGIDDLRVDPVGGIEPADGDDVGGDRPVDLDRILGRARRSGGARARELARGLGVASPPVQPPTRVAAASRAARRRASRVGTRRRSYSRSGFDGRAGRRRRGRALRTRRSRSAVDVRFLTDCCLASEPAARSLHLGPNPRGSILPPSDRRRRLGRRLRSSLFRPVFGDPRVSAR